MGTKPPLRPEAAAGGTILDFRNNRFFGMINGFLGFLTRRKKAYTGRPASAMKYDEIKKRWVIDGEESSDEDVAPPPPPKKQTVPEEIKAAPKEELSGAAALTRPVFAGALANRGRGRGMPANRFPQTFGASQLVEPPAFKEPVEP